MGAVAPTAIVAAMPPMTATRPPIDAMSGAGTEERCADMYLHSEVVLENNGSEDDAAETPPSARGGIR